MGKWKTREELQSPQQTSEVQETAEDASEQHDTEEVAAPDETGVKDKDVSAADLDDRGVPKDNRIKELERKLGKEKTEKESTLTRLEAIEARLAEIGKLNQDRAMDALRGDGFAVPQFVPGYNQRQTAQAPQAQVYGEEEEEGTQTQESQYLTRAEFQRLQLKRANDEAAYQRYKDYLSDQSSPLVQEVLKRRNRDAAAGIDVVNDPNWAANTISAAYGDLVLTGAIDPQNARKKSEEADRRQLVDSTALPGGGRQAPAPRKRVRLSEEERATKEYFEKLAGIKPLSDEAYRASKNRRRKR